MNKRLLLILCAVLFVLCMSMGFYLAYNKVIWTDEMYGQIVMVKERSYWQMIWVHSKNSMDGNVSPLFHIVQKIITDVAKYVVTPDWLTQEEIYKGLNARIVLRIAPVTFMSLSIILIFYYFSRYYSWLAGMYSLFISLISFMVWAFWAEARPYPLLFLFTTMQSLLFLKLLNAKGKEKERLWLQLCFVHVLLILTAVLSIIQICSLSLLLWIAVDRNWKKYIMMFVIPFSLGVYYYSCTPKFPYWFIEGPLEVMNASFSKERMLILAVFGIFILKLLFQTKGSLSKFWNERVKSDAGLKTGVLYFLFTSLMLVGYSLLLAKFKLTEIPGEGFQFPNRYMIALTPIGIIATTIFSIYLVKWQKSSMGKWIVIFFIGAILILRFLRTFHIY